MCILTYRNIQCSIIHSQRQTLNESLTKFLHLMWVLLKSVVEHFLKSLCGSMFCIDLMFGFCMLFLQPPKMGGWPWLEPGRFITRLGFQRCAKWWLKRCTCGRPAQVTVTYCRSCELLAGILLGEGLLGNQVRIDFTRLDRVDSSEGLSPRWLNEFLTEIMENLMEAHKCFS